MKMHEVTKFVKVMNEYRALYMLFFNHIQGYARAYKSLFYTA